MESLIQVGPEGSTGSGSVAGVALYDEGFLLLTGSWNLSTEQIGLISGSSDTNPTWLLYGAGTKDGVNVSTTSATFSSASFDMSFEGQTETQVITMFANASRGETNFSNNPTYLTHGQVVLSSTSSSSV